MNILEEVPEKLAWNLFQLPVVLHGGIAKQMATRQKPQTDVGGDLDILYWQLFFTVVLWNPIKRVTHNNVRILYLYKLLFLSCIENVYFSSYSMFLWSTDCSISNRNEYVEGGAGLLVQLTYRVSHWHGNSLKLFLCKWFKIFQSSDDSHYKQCRASVALKINYPSTHCTCAWWD